LFEGDLKGAGAIFAFVAFWSWAAISAYKHEFKFPREERRRLCAEVHAELSSILGRSTPMTNAIDSVRVKYLVVRPPRHRSSVNSAFDCAVELETKRFTIWLHGKDGALRDWHVR
jgi:hypothetical protein